LKLDNRGERFQSFNLKSLVPHTLLATPEESPFWPPLSRALIGPPCMG
jgi:hypothetical protein